MNGYVAACGEWFPSYRKGIEHERHCVECAEAISKEDEDYPGLYEEDDE